ncbi:FAD-dependent oxidoreductase [Candidatus Uhrbacteria bacterium]|nr:FAD-dependent oxidoreductase [Candidatus Uhrbacteria bacterium]
MYETIVIGGGPAGIAAAIYLARQKVKFLMLGGLFGGKTAWSADVENYLGFHLLDGAELTKKFREHLNDYRGSFELKEGEMAKKAEKMGKGFRLTTDGGTYEARTLLVATGEKNRKLNVPGEDEFMNKGVTYCATCDAPLFKDKVVHVIGGGNSAMDAALFLEKYATSVTIVTVNPELTGDAAMKGKCLVSPKIKVLSSTKTSRILGEQFVSGIGLVGPDGTERTEPTQGVFIEIGLVPEADFIDFVEKDKQGQIIVDKRNRTSIEGVWAAGDVTDVTEKQIAIAVGEGSKAALDIIDFLHKS